MILWLVPLAGMIASASLAAEPASPFREALRPTGDIDRDGVADFSTGPAPDSLTIGNETWWFRKGSPRPYGRLNADSRESTFQWDRNGDGLVDREETTRGGLVRRREDRDFDGVFEEIEEVHPSGDSLLLVRFRHEPTGDRYVLISAVTIPGTFNTPDPAPPLGIPREGADLPVCVPQNVLDDLRAIPALARFYTTGVAREIPVVNVDGTLYWQVNGIRIPADCPNASQILTDYERGIGQGLACLRQMTGTLPAEAFSRLQALVSRPSPDQWVTVRCGSDSSGAAASATMPPLAPRLFVRTQYDASQNMPATMFHEYLHLVGYPHAEGYEMSMTCEACCFGDTGKGPGAIAPGCDLCNTSNPDPYSQAHVSQLSQFYETVGETYYQRNLLLNFIAHSPGSRWGRIALLQAPAFPSTMRKAYALRLLTRTDLTAAERATLTALVAATTAATGPLADLSTGMSNVTEDVFAGIQGGTTSSAWDAALTSVEQSFGRLPTTWTGDRTDHQYAELVTYRGQVIDQLRAHLQGRMFEVIRSVPAWANYDISQIHDLVTRAIPRHPEGTPFGDDAAQEQAAVQIRALIARETEVRTRLSGPQGQEHQAILAIPEPDAARPDPPPDPRGG